MEDKTSSSTKKLLSNQVDQLIRQVKCDFPSEATRSFKKRLLPDLSLQKESGNQEPSPRVFVINPRSPAIKTIYIAEKSRFSSRRGSEKSKSALGIGDHPSFCTYFGETRSSSAIPITGNTDKKQVETPNDTFDQELHDQVQVYKANQRSTEKCYVHAPRRLRSIKHLKPNLNLNEAPNFPESICQLIDPNNINSAYLCNSISNLNKKLQKLKRLLRTQEMVLGDNDPLSSSDDGSRDNMIRNSSGSRPGCSYIEHYSHIPETSAFQRYAQQSGPLSLNKGTTIEKGHNSEQYGRDFTAYDGLTARGRRQCTSATTKRDEPQQAAERMTKIRHKLNPVRDYRLMDTVHYLAQGEFAPRNDGIKLTPSREAVLSDIIWEDVCRTHWPSARLGRRHAQQERGNTRSELQRLIDSLLRERVAHVERRRRRHYRVVKLNNRQENGSTRLGKTGDIIVASHKHKHATDEDDAGVSGHNASGVIMSSKKWLESEHRGRRSHRSDDRLMSPEQGQRRRPAHEESTPGPSYASPRGSARREPTYCYHAAGPSNQPKKLYQSTREDAREKFSSSSTASSEKRLRNPRLVVKKDSRKKYHQKEELNLEHFILLPTLVVRTPSNVKRQKKFNELYHRILNQLSTEQNNAKDEQTEAHSHRNFPKPDSVESMDLL